MSRTDSGSVDLLATAAANHGWLESGIRLDDRASLDVSDAHRSSARRYHQPRKRGVAIKIEITITLTASAISRTVSVS